MAGGSDTKMMERQLRLMQSDHKVNFETTTASIKQQNELIKSLRKENKELAQAQTRLAKDGSSFSAVTFQQREITLLDNKIHAKRRLLDEVKAKNLQSLKASRGIEEVCSSLTAECAPVYTDDSPLDRKVRMLENRLDKSMIKYNEAMSIRRTYEQIARRLTDERIGFDNQLAAIERTLKAKDHDFQELLNMSHDAAHAKDLARSELAQFKAAYEEEKHQKDVEFAEKKRYVYARLDATQKLEKKEKQRIAEDEAAARRAAEQRELEMGQRATNDVKTAEEREREEEYEKHFRRIKDATGVTEGDEAAAVSAVIHKFLRQEEVHKSLVELRKTAEQRIEVLKSERAQLEKSWEEKKYSGSTQLSSRRIVDEFSTHLAEARSQSDKNSVKYERVAKILIAVKAGIEHLTDKLSIYKPENVAPQLTDDNCVDVLRHSEQMLQLLMEESPGGDVGGAETAREVELPKHNVRIKYSEMEEGDEVAEEEDEEVDDLMDRDTVKKLAMMAVQREHKKKRRKGDGKKGKGD